MARKAKPTRQDEVISYILPNGRNALYVGPQILDSDPPQVKEGLTRRRLVSIGGRCLCGAQYPFDPTVIKPGAMNAVIVHEDDCPAAEDNLIAALRRIERGH